VIAAQQRNTIKGLGPYQMQLYTSRGNNCFL
jgi:hypothetical protein